ncbi:unnamed protein product [Prorocentrum cordatum]|uniref:Glycerol-3-phosphate dehydrogenase [NAD(+)] n=1 Tax=Prorocentrum cordatum TaxID=2364126 RepID=A0ABN9SNV3_9DINO|nr:unnamed protein product [Polarella glacialis]
MGMQILDLDSQRRRVLDREAEFPGDTVAHAYVFDDDGVSAADLNGQVRQARVKAAILGDVEFENIKDVRWLVHSVGDDKFGQEKRFVEEVVVERIAEWESGREDTEGDSRILGIHRRQGKRNLAPHDAVEFFMQEEFNDWPFPPSRAAMGYLESIRDGPGSLVVYECEWRQDSGVGDGTAALHEHSNNAEVMLLAHQVDQLNIPNLACFEQLIRRQVQIEMAVEGNAKHPDYGGLDLVMGGPTTESGAAASQSFRDWIYKKQGSGRRRSSRPGFSEKNGSMKINVTKALLGMSVSVDASRLIGRAENATRLAAGLIKHDKHCIGRDAEQIWEFQAARDFPRPYWDPKLANSPQEIISLVHQLRSSNVVGFRRKIKGAMSARQTSDGAVRAKTRVCVFGSGSFGTALGTLVARNGYTVTLLTRREEVAVSVNTKHVNPQHLSECRLPPNLSATTSAEEALRGASFIVHSVPVQSTESFLAPLRDLVPPGVPFISTSKGLHSETLETMNELVPRVLGRPQPMAFLSGPTFAKELVDSQPSGAVMASEDLRVAEACAAIFHCQSLRCYTTDDVIGVEVGGALKNVYALAAGTIEGMGLGVNPMAFMVTRACSEMSCLAVAMGARAHTMAGLAGIGDLMLTCMGGASRNKAVGIKIARLRARVAQHGPSPRGQTAFQTPGAMFFHSVVPESSASETLIPRQSSTSSAQEFETLRSRATFSSPFFFLRDALALAIPRLRITSSSRRGFDSSSITSSGQCRRPCPTAPPARAAPRRSHGAATAQPRRSHGAATARRVCGPRARRFALRAARVQAACAPRAPRAPRGAAPRRTPAALVDAMPQGPVFRGGGAGAAVPPGPAARGESGDAVAADQAAEARGALGAHVAYAIVVEQPGATSTVEKRYSEFSKEEGEPFAPTLCSLPDWRALANFSPQFLERRRQQLEAYLSFLCLHTLVLLDGAILGVTVQMATAHVLCDAPRVAAGIRDLEALLAVGQPAEGCAHPLVLGALRAALADPGVPDEVPTRACRVLERVLTLPRARLLFLPRRAGGVAALLAVHGRGGAAAEAARAVFEALCDADTGPDASAAEGAGPAGQRPSRIEEVKKWDS